MKLVPQCAKAVVFLHEDGKSFSMEPFQILRTASGMTVIRIGRNTFWFDEDGKFDGTEHKVEGIDPNSPEAEMLHEALKLQAQGRGQAPDGEMYFYEGSVGYEAELRGIANATKSPSPVGTGYAAIPTNKRSMQ